MTIFSSMCVSVSVFRLPSRLTLERPSITVRVKTSAIRILSGGVQSIVVAKSRVRIRVRKQRAGGDRLEYRVRVVEKSKLRFGFGFDLWSCEHPCLLSAVLASAFPPRLRGSPPSLPEG